MGITSSKSVYDPQFAFKPEFSYMNKPDATQFINKLNNTFVKQLLTQNEQIFENSFTNTFYPLWFIAINWKNAHNEDLKDETVIKDILLNIYDELFPLGFKFNGYSEQGKSINFYDIEINTRIYFGNHNSENLWTLNNDVLMNLYLDWINRQIMKVREYKYDLPLCLTFSTRVESELPENVKELIFSKYIMYPTLSKTLSNPFIHGNTIYIKDPQYFIKSKQNVNEEQNINN